MEKIELLSPAGDYDCFIAAMNAGADAVYLSGEKFGARAYAKNFATDELVKAIDFAHFFNKKVFLTVNTLLKSEEISELFDYLLPFYQAGLDGVIVQDLGVIAYIRANFPDLAVHASTQLAITGLEGIKLLGELGVKRTVLARELSMKEIEYIHDNSDMEIETFVHGALCYSYSGKCLFSSLVGGRSGNRGRCAGSCRQPYNNKYLLSTKDICCLPIIPELIRAGVTSLKIEGRMKSPEYVAGVTSVYRKYIDLYYENVDRLSFEDIKNNYFNGKMFYKDMDLLTRLYTRGDNSLGYYYKHNGSDMITIDDASYKSDKGEAKSSVNENYVGEHKRIEIKGLVSIHPNNNISILINDNFYYEGGLAEVASKRPLDEQSVKKQICKTGDTEFVFSELDLDVDLNAFVRVSDLNELRRNALLEYKELLLQQFRRELPQRKEDEIITNKMDSYCGKHTDLNCEISSFEQLDRIFKIDSVDGIYVPIDIALKNQNYIFSKAQILNKKLYIKFHSVIRNNYLEKNKAQILELLSSSDGVLADSHEVLQFLKDNNFDKVIVGDVHIYALNKFAENEYKKINISKTTVPVELNKKEILSRNIKGEELIVYGRLPMMISAQCVNNTLNSCDKTGKMIKIKDRKGAEFVAVNNCFDCSNVILNNVPLSYQGEKDFIDKISPSSVRLIFTVEELNELENICSYFNHMINEDKKLQPLLGENSYTKGHLNRGVL